MRTARPRIWLSSDARADHAHEDQALDGLDVGAGPNLLDGDRDAQLRVVAERVDVRLDRALGLVGDFLGELRAAAELLPDDLEDVLGVLVVLGEEDGLRDLVAAREDFGPHALLEGAHDRADLAGVDDGAVELLGLVDELVVDLLEVDGAASACRGP